MSHQQSFLYLYHWTAHIWCCPTPVERMPLPPVSSQSIWIVSGGASNLGNVVCHFCFCSTSSANQLEKSGTLFCPYLCGKKESIMQLWDHCTILHHMNSSDIAAPMTTRWLTSSAPKSDELPWLCWLTSSAPDSQCRLDRTTLSMMMSQQNSSVTEYYYSKGKGCSVAPTSLISLISAARIIP